MAFVLNQAFNSWDDFFAACKVYYDTKFQPMVKKGKLTSVTNANLKDGQRRHPKCFKHINFSYLCTHSGTFKSEGKGKRQTGSVKSGCPGKIYATLNKERTHVVIKQLVATHNHEIGPEFYKHYVLNRQLNSEEKAMARELTRLGVDTKVVRQEIHVATGKPVITKDVWNLKIKMRAEEKRSSVTGKTRNDAEMLVNLIEEWRRGDAGLIADYGLNSKNELEYFFSNQAI